LGVNPEKPMDAEQQAVIEELAERVMDLQEDRLFVYKRFMVRNNKHMTRVIRLSMFGIVILLLAMIMLVSTFTTHMVSITAYMESMAADMSGMRTDFRQVTKRMRSLENSVVVIDQYVAAMPSIYRSVTGMGGEYGRDAGGFGESSWRHAEYSKQNGKHVSPPESDGW
jgi:tetrahydromethanopterin S-methyltransferase subunit G